MNADYPQDAHRVQPKTDDQGKSYRAIVSSPGSAEKHGNGVISPPDCIFCSDGPGCDIQRESLRQGASHWLGLIGAHTVGLQGGLQLVATML